MTIVKYRNLAFRIFMLALAGCAEKPIVPGQPKTANLDLAPYTTREDCVDLLQGDRLDYRFESSTRVKFSIYYRDSNMIVEPITREDVEWADVVVTMGCGDVCPVFPGKEYLDWNLADPVGMCLEEVRELRSVIERRIATL